MSTKKLLKVVSKSAVNNPKINEQKEDPIYTEEERKRFGELHKKLSKSKAPAFMKDKKDHSITPKGDELIHYVGMSEALFSTNPYLENYLSNQLYNAMSNSQERSADFLNAALAVLHGLKPRDELEALLISQMVTTHNSAMVFMSRALLPDQTTDGVTMNTERATKMLRTFTSQMEALNRYRGKGQQKVTVEHVTVNSGGQAIVGAVEPPEGQC